MNDLPDNRTLFKRDAFYSLIEAPLEFMTASLRKGDPWKGADLLPFVNRCRALVAAFDERMELEQQRQEAENK